MSERAPNPGKDECLGDDTTLTVTAGARTTHRIEMVCAWQGR